MPEEQKAFEAYPDPVALQACPEARSGIMSGAAAPFSAPRCPVGRVGRRGQRRRVDGGPSKAPA